MMDLSSEDALRLNVLLANRPQAIRIDESTMTLYGLVEQGEVRVPLNPNCRDDRYLRKVRELLSGQVLGSPGGFPVFLRRWSRMGQTRNENLHNLLLLGEPEAVVALTCAGGLSDELARRAWWTAQDPDNARRMLNIPAVVNGGMGPVLARFLIDYLPFETEPLRLVESLRLALQPGLIDGEQRDALWRRGRRKPAYYLGFLAGLPDDLPERRRPRDFSAAESAALRALAEAGNPFAGQLLRISGGAGQSFLHTLLKVMEKPSNQDVVTLLLDLLRDYLKTLRPAGDPDMTLEALQRESADVDLPAFEACRQAAVGRERELRTLYLLSGVGYGIVRPVFSKSDAIGSLMRKRLEPVFTPLRAYIESLLG